MSNTQGGESEELEFGAPEYLGYRVLQERFNQDNSETGRTKFFKLCCLTNRELIQEYERDIGLPWHWDKYGGVIEEHSVNRGFFFAPSANHQEGQAYYPANEVSETDFGVNEDLQEDIFAAARTVVRRHGRKTRQELQEIQYQEYAPNDFIRTYSDLRWHLVSLSLKQVGQQTLSDFPRDDSPNYTEQRLNEMFRKFPEDEYEEIYEQYLTWDDTMRLMLEEDASTRELHDFFEVFVENLSKVCLRIVHRENIPNKRVNQWEEEIPDHIEKLQNQISEVRKALLEERSEYTVLNTVAEAYDETILQNRQSEL